MVNTSTESTVSWSATFDLNGAVIYGSWNFARSESAGVVTATPTKPWSRILDPNESPNSIGFCATRPGGGSALPSGLSVLGHF